MPVNNLRELFVEQLKDVYDAERRITKALPKMAKAATSDDLRAAFEEHLQETEQHVTRLERVFDMLDEKPGRKVCKAMVGLLQEGEEMMQEAEASAARDAGLICAAQKVEHYEMATYGSLRDWAKILDEGDAAEELQRTLEEEGEADKNLTKVAKSLNHEALEGEDEEEEGEPVMVRRTNPRSQRR
jgi:ferritin-like metal-binding protein YciE